MGILNAKKSKNFTGKDMLNTKNGLALQDAGAVELKMISCATFQKEEDGETKNVGALKCVGEAGEVMYTTISASVIETLSDLIDMEEENLLDVQGTEVSVVMRKSKQGREFLSLYIK